MKKTQKNFEILTIIFTTMLIISNIIAAKVITLNFELFGTDILLPAAIICYPITYLITDIVGEIWGSKEANIIVKYGVIAQICATTIIIIGNYLPALDSEMQNSYNMLLGQNLIFVIGSFASYLTSQFIDVKIFHTIRKKWISKHKDKKLTYGKWLWNNGSTLLSQIIDTSIYIIIAFGIGSGWLWSNPQNLITMIISQYAFKAIIALCDTPFFYFFTRRKVDDK